MDSTEAKSEINLSKAKIIGIDIKCVITYI